MLAVKQISDLKVAKALLRETSQRSGEFRYPRRIAVNAYMESIARYFSWRANESLAPTSRETLLRRFAREMGFPAGRGGRIPTLLLDNELVERHLLHFIYLAFLKRRTEDFLEDYFSQSNQETIDV